MKTNNATELNKKFAVAERRDDNSVERHIPRFQWWSAELRRSLGCARDDKKESGRHREMAIAG